MRITALGKTGGLGQAASGRPAQWPRVVTRVRLCHVVFWALSPVVMVPITGLAADSGGSSPAGQSASASRSPSTVPDFGSVVEDNGLTSPGTRSGPESPNDVYSQPSPLGFGQAAYAPGFSGCATTALNFRGVGTSGFRTELRRPSGPAAQGGRFATVSVAASETYTDNLTLAPDDRAISDFITEISPRLEACAGTGRARGSLVYQPQAVIYHDNSQFNDVYNNIAGDTTIELLAGHLYLGADTRYDQASIDPSLSFSNANALSPDNQTSVWTSNVSPYYLQNLGPVGDASLRYRYGKVIYSDSDIPDSTINGVFFNLTSPENGQALSWTVNAFTQKVRRSGGDQRGFFDGFFDDRDAIFLDDGSVVFRDDDGSVGFLDDGFDDRSDRSNTTHFDKATVELGYQVSPKLELIALGGLEDDYQADGSNDRLGSELYNVGFRWTSAANSLEARVGHRFFGTSYFVRAAHTGRVLDASLDYREEPSTQGLDAANGNAISSNTAFRAPNNSLFDRGVFLQKRLLATVAIDTGLTRTTLRAFDENREFVNNGARDERSVGGDIRVSYQFLPRVEIVPRGGFERRDDRGGVQSDIADAGVSLVRLISPTAQAGISYGHSWRSADQESREYDENRVVVQFQQGF